MPGEDDDQKRSESSPGIPCPRCRARIRVSIETLISLKPIHCPACALELTVNREKSEGSLKALRRLYEGIRRAEATRETGMNVRRSTEADKRSKGGR